MLDCCVILLLLYAVYTGLITVHRHQDYFAQFTFQDLRVGAMDARIYLVTISSTAVCLIDAFLHAYWLVDQGWGNNGFTWGILWLFLHTLYPLLAIYIHKTTDTMLSSPEFITYCHPDRDLKQTPYYKYSTPNHQHTPNYVSIIVKPKTKPESKKLSPQKRPSTKYERR